MIRFLTAHIGLKLFSLFIAVALFCWIHGAEDAQRTLSVEVEALLPDGSAERALISEMPDQVKLKLRGNRSMLDSLARSGIEPIEVNLRDARLQYFYFDPRKLNLPAGVRVTKILPSYVALKWAKQVDQKLPVVARVTTSSRASVRLAGVPAISPAYVIVRGPAPEMQTLQRIYTETVDLDQYGEGEHQVNVALQPLSDHLRYIKEEGQDTRVKVVFRVTSSESEKNFTEVSVFLPENSHLSAEPNKVSVTVRGQHDLLQKLEPSLIQVLPIILAPDGPKQFIAELNVRLPEGLRVSKVTPTKIKLIQDAR